MTGLVEFLKARLFHRRNPDRAYCWGSKSSRFDCSSRLLRDDDVVPVMLSPGRFTRRRPGESWAEATNRLTDGRDL